MRSRLERENKPSEFCSPISSTFNTYQIPDVGNYEHITSKSKLNHQHTNSYINNSSINSNNEVRRSYKFNDFRSKSPVTKVKMTKNRTSTIERINFSNEPLKPKLLHLTKNGLLENQIRFSKKGKKYNTIIPR